MGCPVRKVVSTDAGSALLRDLPRVARIFKAMRAACRVPFTAKMRWDWSDGPGQERSAALEAARIAEAEGLDAICLHARTRAQGYSGQACWEQIAMMKAEVSIPVIGNGDIREPADALAMTAQTGCDAVMIGRALIGDPWLMRETIEAFQTGTAAPHRRAPGWDERRRMMLHHATLMFERRGPKGLVMFRKHAVAYLRGMRGGARMRGELMRVSTLDQLAEVLAAGPDESGSTPEDQFSCNESCPLNDQSC
jgi:nifR3 family TIM-barrel protein